MQGRPPPHTHTHHITHTHTTLHTHTHTHQITHTHTHTPHNTHTPQYTHTHKHILQEHHPGVREGLNRVTSQTLLTSGGQRVRFITTTTKRILTMANGVKENEGQ